jgi:hypothetical protein
MSTNARMRMPPAAKKNAIANSQPINISTLVYFEECAARLRNALRYAMWRGWSLTPDDKRPRLAMILYNGLEGPPGPAGAVTHRWPSTSRPEASGANRTSSSLSPTADCATAAGRRPRSATTARWPRAGARSALLCAGVLPSRTTLAPPCPTPCLGPTADQRRPGLGGLRR